MPNARKRGLTDAQKRAALEHFAAFGDAQGAADLIGYAGPLRTIRNYDCDCRTARARLAAKWTVYFDEARRAFLDGIDGIDVAHKAFRLRELSALYRRAKAANDTAACIAILAAAAKECPPDTGIARMILQLENTDE